MKKEITAIIIITLLSSILMSVFGFAFIKRDSNIIQVEQVSLIKTYGYYANVWVTAILTGVGLSLLGFLLYFKPLKKVYFVFVYLLQIFIILIEGFCLYKFGLSISPPMMSIIADTNNVLEIKGFFETYFDFPSIILVLSILCLGWLIWHFGEIIGNFIIKFKKVFISIFALLVILSFIGVGKIGGFTASTPLALTFYSVKYWIKVKRNLAKLSNDKENRVIITKNESDTPFIIFIIGESESRHFMGMYNKKYDTTPLCQKLVDSGNMFVFTDTISMKSSTAQVMTPLLSFMENTTETTDLKKFDPIVDVFTKAGYQAFWISNHEKITKDLSYATYMSSRCNYAKFTAKISGNTEHTPQYASKDEVVLPPLDEFLKNQVPQKDKNLFIFQIMGSHIRYHDRYPDTFKHFNVSDIKEEGFQDNQKAVLANYLNTILYTDYIMNEIINRFKDKDAILLYVSDHGEEMWQAGFVGHGPTNVSKYMVEIPFLIWVSDSYKEKHPNNISRIQNSLNKPFMTDNLVHVLLDLAGIETKQYDATKSIINEKFIPRERVVVDGLKYEALRK